MVRNDKHFLPQLEVLTSAIVQLVYCGISWKAVWAENEDQCGNLLLLSRAVCSYILFGAGVMVTVHLVQVWFAVRRV
jgi:hypothetical protein